MHQWGVYGTGHVCMWHWLVRAWVVGILIWSRLATNLSPPYSHAFEIMRLPCVEVKKNTKIWNVVFNRMSLWRYWSEWLLAKQDHISMSTTHALSRCPDICHWNDMSCLFREGQTCDKCLSLGGCVHGGCSKPFECNCSLAANVTMRDKFTGDHCDIGKYLGCVQVQNSSQTRAQNQAFWGLF